MNDIVERLRLSADRTCDCADCAIRREAADEIETLIATKVHPWQAMIRKLREYVDRDMDQAAEIERLQNTLGLA